jgi:hypothetical protein
MANSDHYPASGKSTTSGRPYSGVNETSDVTNEPGQYPPGDWGSSLFGGPLPSGTGAPGTQGASLGGNTDSTNEPGQTVDGFTGIPDGQIGGTGATGLPGTQGAQDHSGGQAITYTYPNDGIGPYAPTTVNDSTAGPTDSTQANDQGYATNGPQLPGIKGNEPQAGGSQWQTGSGKVMRGGRDVKP